MSILRDQTHVVVASLLTDNQARCSQLLDLSAIAVLCLRTEHYAIQSRRKVDFSAAERVVSSPTHSLATSLYATVGGVRRRRTTTVSDCLTRRRRPRFLRLVRILCRSLRLRSCTGEVLQPSNLACKPLFTLKHTTRQSLTI